MQNFMLKNTTRQHEHPIKKWGVRQEVLAFTWCTTLFLRGLHTTSPQTTVVVDTDTDVAHSIHCIHCAFYFHSIFICTTTTGTIHLPSPSQYFQFDRSNHLLTFYTATLNLSLIQSIKYYVVIASPNLLHGIFRPAHEQLHERSNWQCS